MIVYNGHRATEGHGRQAKAFRETPAEAFGGYAAALAALRPLVPDPRAAADGLWSELVRRGQLLPFHTFAFRSLFAFVLRPGAWREACS